MKRASLFPVGAAIAAGLALILAVTGVVILRSTRALRSAFEDVRAEQQFPFLVRVLPPVANTAFEPVSSPAVFVQAARFQDHLYLAGPAGLSEYDSNSGALVHHYTVGNELPGSSLIGLAPAVLAESRQPELIIATASDGLLAFNGRDFRQILPASKDARAVTTLLSALSGHLIFGTKKRGVLLYDGKQIAVLHATLDGLYVTALAGSESDLWVGTLNRGVLHFHAGETDSFGEAQGLPDPEVLALAISGDATYVGTATGVAVFRGGRFSGVLARGLLATAVLATPGQLYVGTEDQGVITIPLQHGRSSPGLAEADSQFASEGKAEMGEIRQLFSSGDATFALSRSGLYRRNPHAFGWQRVLDSGAAILSDRNISALAADGNGKLWVGYFDHGLDVLAANRERAIHVENEHVFCVNRIVSDARNDTVDVATANGLVRFDSSGSEQQVLTRADGLIADHVTDVALYRDGLAIATPAGLTFLDSNGARSMYAFHGLVNNRVYALGVSGDELMAGTLGGLSQLNNADVAANYTTATSNLKHNWITAVVPVGSEWVVGTYGAGVLGLDGAGHFRAFETGSGAFEVNPNAMLVTPNWVLAGTLGEGLYLYDRRLERWSVIREGLPSANVTALASANGYFYVGTDNGLVRIAEQKLRP